MTTLFSPSNTSFDSDIKKRIKKFYDTASTHLVNLWGPHFHVGYYASHKENKEEAQENMIKLLADVANIQSGDRVLDVGCGIGGTSVFLEKKYKVQAFGITISLEQAKIAQTLAQKERAHSLFAVMDAEQITFLKPFDIIWVLEAMSHFPNKKEFLKKSIELLSPGGRIVIGDYMLCDESLQTEEIKGVVNPILNGLLIPKAISMNSHVKMLLDAGYRVIFLKDITKQTLKTWEMTALFISKPSLWQLAYKHGEIFVNCLDSFRKIRKVMREGKMRYGIIIAEKI